MNIDEENVPQQMKVQLADDSNQGTISMSPGDSTLERESEKFVDGMFNEYIEKKKRNEELQKEYEEEELKPQETVEDKIKFEQKKEEEKDKEKEQSFGKEANKENNINITNSIGKKPFPGSNPMMFRSHFKPFTPTAKLTPSVAPVTEKKKEVIKNECEFIIPSIPLNQEYSDSTLASQCDKFVNSLFKEYVYEKTKRKINVTTITEDEAKNLDYYKKYQNEIIKIQNNWKTHYDLQKIQILKEKTFYIQRSFRNYLIKKYNLPYNFYYNDKFMKIQNNIFEDNYRDNLSVLFPALFLDKSDLNYFASNMVAMSNNPTHNPYETGKINLFGKILDFDMMIETDECYETLWASIFDSIYSKCLKSNAPIQLLALGGQHTLCVNNKGKIFTFGWNNYGQCGVPINSTIISKNDLNNNYLVEVTKYNELKPKIVNRVDGVKIPEIDQVIMSNAIACGEDHSLILDQEGGVWAFGLNLNGQLGLGHTNVVEKPTKITSLNKHFITSVKSEGNINFAISNKGEAFMWPWSDKGTIQYIPKRFSLRTATEKITSIACGNNFVLILNNAGMVYSMGRTNKFGQLGHGDYEPRLHPSLIQYFVSNQERITQISCGFKHCVAKSAVNRAYTWGMGCKGQLGHNNYSNLTIPSMVRMDNFTKVYQVSAGFRCTFFLCDNRKIYACGCNGTISMEKTPVPFDIIDKIPEMSLEQSYSVVRIMNTWNKSFSVFYCTIADCSCVKMSPVKLNNILNQLAYKWDYEGINAPYIETIAKYFPISFMKKPPQPYNK